MARDPLRILLSVRTNAVEQARSALGACLKAEADIVERIRSFEEALRRDRETSAAWQDAHQFLEMSAIHLAVMRSEREAAAAALAAAEAASADARNVVTTARTAAEAVDQLINERDAANQAEQAKRQQHELDDIARARHALRQRSAINQSRRARTYGNDPV